MPTRATVPSRRSVRWAAQNGPRGLHGGGAVLVPGSANDPERPRPW